jgi:hypothetical protein
MTGPTKEEKGMAKRISTDRLDFTSQSNPLGVKEAKRA